MRVVSAIKTIQKEQTELQSIQSKMSMEQKGIYIVDTAKLSIVVVSGHKETVLSDGARWRGERGVSIGLNAQQARRA